MRVWPVPASGSLRMELDCPTPGSIELPVIDVRGAQVAVLAAGRVTRGVLRTVWNGRDRRGRPVASGVYFVRAVGAGMKLTRRVVVVR